MSGGTKKPPQNKAVKPADKPKPIKTAASGGTKKPPKNG